MKKHIKEIAPVLKSKSGLLVSMRGKDGKNNALVVGYCCNCSYDPPMVMVGIVPSRFSHGLVKESGSFVVNLVSKEQKELFDYMGNHSGRDEDKFERMNVKTMEATKIDGPILYDCPVNIECKVVDSIISGSHEMFVGKIEAIHADEEYINEEGKIDFSKIDLL